MRASAYRANALPITFPSVRVRAVTILFVALVAPALCRAADPPRREIVVDQAEVRVAGVHGQKVKRLLVLSLTGSTEPVTIALHAMNLRAAEGDDAEPALAFVPADPPRLTLHPGRPGEVLLTFDLTSLDHGEYKSKLQVLIGEDVVKELPMTIKVRHALQWPLTVLLSGVLLGVGISWYRSRGQTRDQICSRLDDLEVLAADTTIQQEFRDAIAARIADTQTAMKSGTDPAEALKSLDQGEAIALRWSRNRSEWEELFNYIKTLRTELQQFPASSKTVDMVLESIRDAGRKVPLQDTPDTLRVNLNGWRVQVERFRVTLAAVNRFDLRRREAPPRIASAFEGKVDALRQRLDLIEPSDSPGFQSINTDIDAAVRELDLAIQQAPAAHIAVGMVDAGQPDRDIPHVNPPISALSAVPIALVKSKTRRFFSWILPTEMIPRQWKRVYQLRLGLFRWFGYLAPVAVFVYTGMVQFYQANPAFGSFSHYIALFLWGFGADATGTKVQDLIRNASNRIPPPTLEPPKPITG